MEIRVLRYFLAVAREGSLTRAANFLHITQPTLSRQIQNLERELGQKLFTRRPHSMSLTSQGFLLRSRAEEIISMVEKTENEFSSLGQNISGDVYIGAAETHIFSYLAQVMKDLQSRFPEIRYHLYSGNAADVTERLDKGLLDFGLLMQPADISKYNYLNLPGKDTWGIIMRRDDPLAQRPYLEKKDLLQLPLILSHQAISEEHAQNDFTRWFGDDFRQLNIVATFNLLYNATYLAEAGLGYIISVDHIAHTGTTEPLCFIPLAPTYEVRLNFIWKKYQIFSPAAETFLQALREKVDSGQEAK